jgi:hypothetical protein
MMPRMGATTDLRVVGRFGILACFLGGSALGCSNSVGQGVDGGGPPQQDGALTLPDGAAICGAGPTVDSNLSGVQLFPADNPWNTAIDGEPVDPMSAAIINNSGAQVIVETAMPINVTCGITPMATFKFKYASISDPGPYPITTLIDPMTTTMPLALGQESGPCGANCDDGKDHHVLIYSKTDQKLFEIYQAYQSGGQWNGSSGAIFDVTSNALRADGKGSSDAAGLPVIPGLVRCDEVASGAINHALRFTLGQTKPSFVHPATHFTHTSGSAPMGARFRLKASFDITPFSANAQVILKALKKYGMFVADNGTNYGITGERSKDCWVNLKLSEFPWGSGFFFISSKTGNAALTGGDFEVIQMGPQLTTEL